MASRIAGALLNQMVLRAVARHSAYVPFKAPRKRRCNQTYSTRRVLPREHLRILLNNGLLEVLSTGALNRVPKPGLECLCA